MFNDEIELIHCNVYTEIIVQNFEICYFLLLLHSFSFTDSTCKTSQDASLREINVQNKNKMQSRAYIGTVAGQRGNPKLVD